MAAVAVENSDRKNENLLFMAWRIPRFAPTDARKDCRMSNRPAFIVSFTAATRACRALCQHGSRKPLSRHTPRRRHATLHRHATRTADVQRYGGAMAGNRGAGGLRVMGDGRVVLGKPALII